jgi:hypothetical protein
LTDDGVNALWASFSSHTFRRDLAFDAAELAKVAMNERPRLLAQRDELLAALIHLRNEARGCVGLNEPEMRALVGNANFACLTNRIEEAEQAIRKAEEADRERA